MSGSLLFLFGFRRIIRSLHLEFISFRRHAGHLFERAVKVLFVLITHVISNRFYRKIGGFEHFYALFYPEFRYELRERFALTFLEYLGKIVGRIKVFPRDFRQRYLLIIVFLDIIDDFGQNGFHVLFDLQRVVLRDFSENMDEKIFKAVMHYFSVTGFLVFQFVLHLRKNLLDAERLIGLKPDHGRDVAHIELLKRAERKNIDRVERRTELLIDKLGRNKAIIYPQSVVRDKTMLIRFVENDKVAVLHEKVVAVDYLLAATRINISNLEEIVTMERFFRGVIMLIHNNRFQTLVLLLFFKLKNFAHIFTLFRFYPFMPPRAILSIIVFWNTMNIARIGKVERIISANRCGYFIDPPEIAFWT